MGRLLIITVECQYTLPLILIGEFMKCCIRCKKEKPVLDFYSSRNVCKECKKSQVKNWKKDNIEKCNSYRKTWKTLNPSADKAAKAKWALNNKPKISNKRLKHLYGITLQEYIAILELQGFSCAICKSTSCQSKRNFAVDHNHVTGEVRGLLCKRCNTALGLFQDSPSIIFSAVNYLKERGYYGITKD